MSSVGQQVVARVSAWKKKKKKKVYVHASAGPNPAMNQLINPRVILQNLTEGIRMDDSKY
jgi:hypothetical protein